MVRKQATSKDKLIETAMELIWAESYNAVSVDDICKKAGVQKGSFYHFFPSKGHLALATMDAAMEENRKALNEIFSPIHRPVDRLEKMVDYIIEKQKEVRGQVGYVCGCPLATLGAELAVQDADIGKKVNDICSEKLKYYESCLRDLVSNGDIDPDTDITIVAENVSALIVGQLVMARIKNDLGVLEKNLKSSVFQLIGLKKT